MKASMAVSLLISSQEFFMSNHRAKKSLDVSSCFCVHHCRSPAVYGRLYVPSKFLVKAASKSCIHCRAGPTRNSGRYMTTLFGVPPANSTAPKKSYSQVCGFSTLHML
jgi:hypothetical protein